jgi:hypothetical protein
VISPCQKRFLDSLEEIIFRKESDELMKFNKNKTWLVVIVAVLALTLLLSGCTDASGSKAPGFLEVGGYYAAIDGGQPYQFKLLEIRADGWILVDLAAGRGGHEYLAWLNTAQISYIRVIEKP